MEIDWGDVERLKRERPALVLELMTAGDAEGFRRALDAGFGVDVMSDVGGSMRTPAHHAAAAGDVASLRLLVERGADLSVRDPTYDATPLGWAEFFDDPEAAAYLREVFGRAGAPATGDSARAAGVDAKVLDQRSATNT